MDRDKYVPRTGMNQKVHIRRPLNLHAIAHMLIAYAPRTNIAHWSDAYIVAIDILISPVATLAY